MKEFGNQEVREKMSWKGFASKFMQPDASSYKCFCLNEKLQEVNRAFYLLIKFNEKYMANWFDKRSATFIS